MRDKNCILISDKYFISLFKYITEKIKQLLHMDSSDAYVFCTHELVKEEPTGNQIGNSKCPLPRSGHRSVFYNGNLYVFGGYASRCSDSNALFAPCLFKEMWKFNYASKMWIKLNIKGDMPSQLASHAATLYHNNMIVYGGTEIPFGQNNSNATHLCNLETLEWKTLNTSGELPPPLYGQAITVHDNKLYAVGGTSGNEFFLAVNCLDLLTYEWTRLDTLKIQDCIPEPRYRHEIVVFNDCIYIFGGGTVDESFDLINIPTFNLKDKTWRFLETSSSENNHPYPRLCFGCVHMDNEVYIFGGYDCRNSFSDIWKLDLVNLTWSELITSLPVSLAFHSASSSEEGQAFVFGGVVNYLEGIRTNDMYTVWLKIPSLSQICWQVLIKYFPHMSRIDKQKLYTIGIPKCFLHEIEDLGSSL